MTLSDRKLNLYVLLLCPVSLMAAEQPPPLADSVEQADTKTPDHLLADLGSKDFAVRSNASARLKEVTADELLKLSEKLPDQPNAEVVVRIQAEIEARYTSSDPANVQMASQLLETQAADKRLMLADVAQQTLRRHWQQRIEIAIKEIEQHGAIVRRGAFAASQRFNPFPGRGGGNGKAFSILLTETWTGGDAELAIFERLTALYGPVLGDHGAKLFLLAGNRLTDDQEQRLIELIGQNRVAKRSRVALGIVQYPNNDEGVLIDKVTPGSSAADAGLRKGDLIVAIEPKFAKSKPDSEDAPLQIIPKGAEDKSLIRDFDDLVERLMDYREGDIMIVRVRRAVGYLGGRFLPEGRPEPVLETVKVKMKGWQALIPE